MTERVTVMLSRGSLSRRRFIAGTAASLAAAPWVASADPESGSYVTGASDAGHRLTIPVHIAGKGPFQFVVDTGADRTVLSDDVAGALGLIRGAPVSVQGIARTVDAQTVRLDDLVFGSEVVNAIEAPVLPHAWLEADGFLGLNAIDKRRVAFDFRRQTLGITASHHLQSVNVIRPDENVVSVDGYSGRLRAVNCRVDGVHAYAFIDSGAEVSVGNTALLSALLEHSPAYATSETAQLTGVTGGSVTGSVTRVSQVHLGGFSFSDDGLVIADLQVFGLWGLASRPALFIGMDVLRQFAQVVIDYGRKEYRFEFASVV
jgi:predicted aspartyl protease